MARSVGMRLGAAGKKRRRRTSVFPRTDEAIAKERLRRAREQQRSDDVADYVPTQILAELFRTEEYDGLIYRGAFGDNAFSVALFDLDSAKCHRVAVYSTTSTRFRFKKFEVPFSVF